MSTPSVFTIPPDRPFLDDLALGLHADPRFGLGAEPAAMAKWRIFLPTRRACRSLAEAFIRANGGRPLLLPRITPLGDIDEDELAFRPSDGADEQGHDRAVLAAVPPAIAPLRRQLLLARLVTKHKDGAISPDQAVRLAGELARLLDQVHTEGLDFSALQDLVPDDFARHWQITLTFLAIITEHWPRILAEEGAIDPADRRSRLLLAQAEAVAGEAAGDAGDRRRLHRQHSGDRRAAGGRGPAAAGRGDPARPRHRRRRGDLGGAGALAPAVRHGPAARAHGDRPRRGRHLAGAGADQRPVANAAGAADQPGAAARGQRPRRGRLAAAGAGAGGGFPPRRADAAGRGPSHRPGAARGSGAPAPPRHAGHARPGHRQAGRGRAAALGGGGRRQRRRAAGEDAARHVPPPDRADADRGAGAGAAAGGAEASAGGLRAGSSRLPLAGPPAGAAGAAGSAAGAGSGRPARGGRSRRRRPAGRHDRPAGSRDPAVHGAWPGRSAAAVARSWPRILPSPRRWPPTGASLEHGGSGPARRASRRWRSPRRWPKRQTMRPLSAFAPTRRSSTNSCPGAPSARATAATRGSRSSGHWRRG